MNPAPSTNNKGEEEGKEHLAYFGKNNMDAVERITMQQHEEDMEGFFD